MYFPYFRGKQFELIVIREMAPLLEKSDFIPIIEPVRDNFTGLKRALDEIVRANGKAIVIINPIYGDHNEDSSAITNLLLNNYAENKSISAGVLLDSEMKVDNAIECFDEHKLLNPSFIHAGFGNPPIYNRVQK